MFSSKRRFAAASFFCIPLAGCLNSQDGLSPNDLAVSALVAAPATPCVGNTALPRTGATSSSNETPALAAAMAIDGNAVTRWSSAWSDPQWIRIDLGAVRFISAVTLKWEAASAQRYDIQVSPDGNSWKSVQTVAWGQPGPAVIPITGLNARGRYLRVYTHSRTTQYGVSLFEIEPRGDLNGACSEPSAVRIDAVHSGKSLDVKDWSTQPGGQIQQWGFGGQDNQKWRLNPRPDGQYEIRSVFSQLCLDVSGNSMANGALIVQWNCHNGPNQSFLLESVSPGKFRIRAVSSNKCLDIKGVSAADGALLQQWDCNPAGQANQTFSILEPGDFKNDPANCGYAGHSCQGGLCSDGACQASIVANDFQCSSGMAADDQYIWVGDQAGLFRYDITGYNKTTVMSREPGSFMYDLQRNNGQFFWNDDRARRLNPGQTAPAAVTDFAMSQLAVNGNNLIGLDYPTNRFVSVDRNQNAPGTVTAIHTVPAGEYPMYSSVTSAYIYYVTGTSNGSVVYQVNRNTGARKSLNGSGTGESVFGMTTFNEHVYWSYRSASGISGIRRLSPLPGSTVQEAVPTGGSLQGVGNPMVDASGIYHSWYDGNTNGFYRTPHSNAGTRTLVTTYVYPYDARYVTFTSTSMIWLNACNRGGGGQVWKLAKP